MNLTFAIPDLHGRKDLLDRAIDSINHYADTAGAGARTIVCLGDYVDRGPDSCGVIERLMELRSCLQFRLVCLLGNHDFMMRAGCLDGLGLTRSDWITVGGDATLKSYEQAGFVGDPPTHHIDWLRSLPQVLQDRHRIYVHAAIDPTRAITDQTQRTLLWQRYADDEPGGYHGRHVVHGHTPNRNGPLQLSGRTALDTLAWRTGRLVIGVFDDALPGGTFDRIEVQGDPYGNGGQP